MVSLYHDGNSTRCPQRLRNHWIGLPYRIGFMWIRLDLLDYLIRMNLPQMKNFHKNLLLHMILMKVLLKLDANQDFNRAAINFFHKNLWE